MKQINHKIQPYLWAILVILVAFVLFWLTGCIVAKREQRKDDKAVNRINANAELQSKVASKWLDAHPPIEGKPEIKYLPGEVQIKEIPVTDYKNLQRIKDSLIKALGDTCQDYSITAYQSGFDQAERYYKENPFIRIDTKEISTPDLKEANRWRDSTNKWKSISDYEKGKNDTLQEQLSETKRKNNNMWWLVLAISVGAVLTHVLRSYLPNIKL